MGASSDAYIKQDGTTWTLGTAAVERVVALEDGKLLLKEFKDKISGHELAANGSEFAFALGSPENCITGASGGWTLVDVKESKGAQGELQLDLHLNRDGIETTKSYVVYPESSIIREWATFKNVGAASVCLINPGFLNMNVRTGKPAALDFHWMTGGENQAGSWGLRTEKLNAEKPRRFDSYEPFPLDMSKAAFPGDGINAKILHNDTQVWPASGWKYVANATVVEPFDATIEVVAGDKLVFLVNMNAGIGYRR